MEGMAQWRACTAMAGGGCGAAPAMDHSNMDMRDKSKVDVPGRRRRRHDRAQPGGPHRRSRPRPRGCRPQGAHLSRPRLADAEPGQARADAAIDIHLTGNMERFMWSIDGEKLSERPEPIRFERNERVRLHLINDTMMTHPMHLHGHFFEVVNGHGQPAGEAHGDGAARRQGRASTSPPTRPATGRSTATCSTTCMPA
jgi:FtsP/CotA-like multicopper oxidase with cupredoxin domain